MMPYTEPYREIKARAGESEAEGKLFVLYNEMLRHVESLRTLVARIQSVELAAGQELFEGYTHIRNGLPQRVDALAALLVEVCEAGNLSPAEKLAQLCQRLPGPSLAFVHSFADLTLEALAEKAVPGLPPEYGRWVRELKEGADGILVLVEALQGGR